MFKEILQYSMRRGRLYRSCLYRSTMCTTTSQSQVAYQEVVSIPSMPLKDYETYHMRKACERARRAMRDENISLRLSSAPDFEPACNCACFGVFEPEGSCRPLAGGRAGGGCMARCDVPKPGLGCTLGDV